MPWLYELIVPGDGANKLNASIDSIYYSVWPVVNFRTNKIPWNWINDIRSRFSHSPVINKLECRCTKMYCGKQTSQLGLRVKHYVLKRVRQPTATVNITNIGGGDADEENEREADRPDWSTILPSSSIGLHALLTCHRVCVLKSSPILHNSWWQTVALVHQGHWNEKRSKFTFASREMGCSSLFPRRLK